MSDTSLPLTEHVQPREPPNAAQEAEVAQVISRFYSRVMEDPLLAPVFNAHVTDWDPHLARMQDFWMSVVYKVGRYAGNPLRVHRALGELRPEHFVRWLTLWQQTVEETVTSDIGPTLIVNAQQMGAGMSARLAADRPGTG